MHSVAKLKKKTTSPIISTPNVRFSLFCLIPDRNCREKLEGPALQRGTFQKKPGCSVRNEV